MVNFHLVERMKINENTSVVDVALNLSGSLAGLPVVVEQLPVGELVGFDAMPIPGEDVADIGQTWTPDLQGKEVDLDVPVYNPSAQQKEPYTTNMTDIAPVIAEGEEWVNALLSAQANGQRIMRVTDIPIGFNLRGCKMVFTMQHLKPKPGVNNYGINCRQFIEYRYLGDLLVHYGVNNEGSLANRMMRFVAYNYGVDSGGPYSEIIYDDPGGWRLKQIEFDPLVDNFMTSTSLANDTYDDGYWNWNYAYIILPEFPNPKKKVCDIPKGFNLRGKTIYFRAPELEFDLSRVDNPAYDWLNAVATSGKVYEIRAYRKDPAQRNGIIVTATGDATVRIYDSYKGSFVATKYTFPDTEDIIVTYNSLTIRSLNQWGWGFDYAEVSDDPTLDIPVPDTTRPFAVYRNLNRCNLDGWQNWVAAATPPSIASDGSILYTTSGEAESYNGGGVFVGALPNYSVVGDTVRLKMQVRSADSRTVRMHMRTLSNVEASASLSVSVTVVNRWIQGSAERIITTDGATNVMVSKPYAENAPGTYRVQNIEVLLFKKLD